MNFQQTLSLPKKIIFLSVLFILSISLNAQSCLPGGIEFTSQEEIDNFAANYPGCSIIEGDVLIMSPTITNLNGLSQIVEIGGFLNIRQSNMLTELSGLHNLTSVGGFVDLFQNSQLNSLNHLSQLQNIGNSLSIMHCNELVN